MGDSSSESASESWSQLSLSWGEFEWASSRLGIVGG